MIKSNISRSFGFEYAHSVDLKATESLNTRHCHDCYEIIFVTSGTGRYLIEGAEFELRPRTIALIRPFAYHCVEVNTDTSYERYILHFTHSCLLKDIRDVLDRLADESSGESGMFFPSDVISQSLVSLFDRFEDTANIPDDRQDMYYKLILSEILFLLSVSASQKIAHNEGELGAMVARYINDYLEKDISLDVIAKRFFLSKYYLCRSFKKYSGVSIHAYITQKRVMYAKRLIESGETASGAAYKVGFGDYSAFYRAYVKVIGKPPTSKQTSKKSGKDSEK